MKLKIHKKIRRKRKKNCNSVIHVRDITEIGLKTKEEQTKSNITLLKLHPYSNLSLFPMSIASKNGKQLEMKKKENVVTHKFLNENEKIS